MPTDRRPRTNASGRPPARDIAVVFALGIVGTLVPIVGWIVGVVLVLRASAWSRTEKAIAIVGPFVLLMVAVALAATAFGANVRPLPMLAAVPLTGSLSSAIGAIYLAQRLGAHKRAHDAARG